MYKPSPEAMKKMMAVKPQGENYEAQGGSRVPPTNAVSEDEAPPKSNPPDNTGTTSRSAPHVSQRTNSGSSDGISNSGGTAGLFAEKKDAKPMPMNARRTVPIPGFTRREKKPRSATMLRRTGSNASYFSTDDAMSMSIDRVPTQDSFATMNSVKEETAPVSSVVVSDDRSSPVTYLSEESLQKNLRQDELVKEHQAKMEQLEWQMQQQIQEQQRKNAELQQALNRVSNHSPSAPAAHPPVLQPGGGQQQQPGAQPRNPQQNQFQPIQQRQQQPQQNNQWHNQQPNPFPMQQQDRPSQQRPVNVQPSPQQQQQGQYPQGQQQQHPQAQVQYRQHPQGQPQLQGQQRLSQNSPQRPNHLFTHGQVPAQPKGQMLQLQQAQSPQQYQGMQHQPQQEQIRPQQTQRGQMQQQQAQMKQPPPNSHSNMPPPPLAQQQAQGQGQGQPPNPQMQANFQSAAGNSQARPQQQQQQRQFAISGQPKVPQHPFNQGEAQPPGVTPTKKQQQLQVATQDSSGQTRLPQDDLAGAKTPQMQNRKSNAGQLQHQAPQQQHGAAGGARAVQGSSGQSRIPGDPQRAMTPLSLADNKGGQQTNQPLGQGMARRAQGVANPYWPQSQPMNRQAQYSVPQRPRQASAGVQPAPSIAQQQTPPQALNGQAQNPMPQRPRHASAGVQPAPSIAQQQVAAQPGAGSQGQKQQHAVATNQQHPQGHPQVAPKQQSRQQLPPGPPQQYGGAQPSGFQQSSVPPPPSPSPSQASQVQQQRTAQALLALNAVAAVTEPSSKGGTQTPSQPSYQQNAQQLAQQPVQGQRARTLSQDSRASHMSEISGVSALSQNLPQFTPDRREVGFPGQVLHQYSAAQTPATILESTPSKEEDDSSDWLASLTTQTVQQQRRPATAASVPNTSQAPISPQQIEKRPMATNEPYNGVAAQQQQAQGPTRPSMGPASVTALAALWSQAEANHVAQPHHGQVHYPQTQPQIQRSNQVLAPQQGVPSPANYQQAQGQPYPTQMNQPPNAQMQPQQHQQAQFRPHGALPQHPPQMQQQRNAIVPVVTAQAAAPYNQTPAPLPQQSHPPGSAQRPMPEISERSHTTRASHARSVHSVETQLHANVPSGARPGVATNHYVQQPQAGAGAVVGRPGTPQPSPRGVPTYQENAFENQTPLGSAPWAAAGATAGVAVAANHFTHQQAGAVAVNTVQAQRPPSDRRDAPSYRDEFENQTHMGASVQVREDSQPDSPPHWKKDDANANADTRKVKRKSSARNGDGSRKSKTGSSARQGAAGNRSGNSSGAASGNNRQSGGGGGGAAGAVATTNSRRRKAPGYCIYLNFCLIFLLVGGGATFACLYFFTDVFDFLKDEDSSPSPMPSPPPTISPSPTTETTTEDTLEIIPNDPLETSGNQTDNEPIFEITWEDDDGFTEMDPDTILDEGLNRTSNATATVAPVIVESSDVIVTAADNPFWPENRTAQTFVWQEVRSIAGTGPDAQAGSFLAMNSDGSVIVVGAAEDAVVVYRILENSAVQQMGFPLSILVSAEAVSAAMSGDGTIVAIGYDDGSVQAYRYNETGDVGSGDGTWVPRGDEILVAGAPLRARSTAVALAANGVVLVVGILDDDTDVVTVQPFLYNTTSSIWNPIGGAIERTGRRDETTVQISANGFAIAFTSLYDNEDGVRYGSVETFELDDIYGGTNATARGSFVFEDVAQLSVSLSVNGNIMAVANEKVSSVYGFDWIDRAWDIQAGGNYLSGGSMISLSFSGQLVAIGGQNHVDTYEFIDEQWMRHPAARRRLILKGEEDMDGFGSSLVISGDASKMAVGAPFVDDDRMGRDSGTVYLFDAVSNNDYWGV